MYLGALNSGSLNKPNQKINAPPILLFKSDIVITYFTAASQSEKRGNQLTIGPELSAPFFSLFFCIWAPCVNS